MNIRSKEMTTQTENKITFCHRIPIFPNILNARALYTFPSKVLAARGKSPRYKIRGSRGTIRYIFKHTKNITCFIIQITHGRLEGKYVVSSRTAFKKTGKITLGLSNFDTAKNTKLRRIHTKNTPKQKEQ